MIDVDI